MNIALIGARGSGKTTLGRMLAERLGLGFVDLDALTLARFGEPTVQAVWEHLGERAWRLAEAAELGEVLRTDRQVVATGGGTPMITSARHLMANEQRLGRLAIVFLDCSVAELMRRLSDAPGDRPRLTGEPTPLDEVSAVLVERRPVYLQLADLVHDAAAEAPAETTEAIVRWIRDRGGA